MGEGAGDPQWPAGEGAELSSRTERVDEGHSRLRVTVLVGAH